MTSPTGKPVRIVIDPANPLRLSELTVDGQDVKDHIFRYTLTHRADEPAKLVLEGHRLDAVFDGVADVGILAQDVAVGEAAATFLEAMDPEKIRELSLAAQQWLGGSQTEASLKVLVDLARGGTGNFSPNRE